MNKDELRNILISEISEMVDMPKEEIGDDMSLIEDLDMSSLELMTLLGAITEKCHIKFDESEKRNIDSVGNLLECIEEKLGI